MQVSGDIARGPGRDGRSDTGLYEYNRQDMTVEAMETRAAEWTEGDLFAVFRDDLGGMHAQHSRYEDFFEVAMTQLIRSRRRLVGIHVDREMAMYLVGMLMISRLHNYHFENFLELRDHANRQVFDMRNLCSWIARNEFLFMTEAEATLEDSLADHLDELRDDESRIAELMEEAA